MSYEDPVHIKKDKLKEDDSMIVVCIDHENMLYIPIPTSVEEYKKIIDREKEEVRKECLEGLILYASSENKKELAESILKNYKEEIDNYFIGYSFNEFILKSNKEAVKVFVKNGANIYWKDEDGNTVIDNARKIGNKEIIKCLECVEEKLLKDASKELSKETKQTQNLGNSI